MRITNPVFFDLINLKLTKRRNLIKLNEKTRDADINVFKDTKTKILSLEKAIRKKSYYKNIDYGNKRSKQKMVRLTSIMNSWKKMRTTRRDLS